MIPAWVESVVPLALITGLIAAAGGLQYGVHWSFFGKPKLVGADEWDRLAAARDERLKELAKQTGSK